MHYWNNGKSFLIIYYFEEGKNILKEIANMSQAFWSIQYLNQNTFLYCLKPQSRSATYMTSQINPVLMKRI